MHKLKAIKECLVDRVEQELQQDLCHVDTCELGEVIDMIKDLEESMYYCCKIKKMCKEMEEHMCVCGRVIPEEIITHEEHYMERDYREGQSPIQRKYYMEAKELKQDKKIQMQELEKYMCELSKDITEMISDSSPEETTLLKQKLVTLIEKIK